MSKVTTFRYSDDTKKQLDDLKRHLQEYNLGAITQSDVIKLAIKEMHEKYINDK